MSFSGTEFQPEDAHDAFVAALRTASVATQPQLRRGGDRDPCAGHWLDDCYLQRARRRRAGAAAVPSPGPPGRDCLRPRRDRIDADRPGLAASRAQLRRHRNVPRLEPDRPVFARDRKRQGARGLTELLLNPRRKLRARSGPAADRQRARLHWSGHREWALLAAARGRRHPGRAHTRDQSPQLSDHGRAADRRNHRRSRRQPTRHLRADRLRSVAAPGEARLYGLLGIRPTQIARVDSSSACRPRPRPRDAAPRLSQRLQRAARAGSRHRPLDRQADRRRNATGPARHTDRMRTAPAHRLREPCQPAARAQRAPPARVRNARHPRCEHRTTAEAATCRERCPRAGWHRAWHCAGLCRTAPPAPAEGAAVATPRPRCVACAGACLCCRHHARDLPAAHIAAGAAHPTTGAAARPRRCRPHLGIR